MKVAEIRRHRSICLMGLGNVFLDHQDYLGEAFSILFVTDNDQTAAQRHLGYDYIPPERLDTLDDPFVIVTTSRVNYAHISQQLAVSGIPHCLFADIEGVDEVNYPVVDLASLEGAYADHLGNTIEWHGSAAPDTRIYFGRSGKSGQPPVKARNNRLVIGENAHLAGRCRIAFTGSGSLVEIGRDNWIGGDMELAINSESYFTTGERCTFESINAATHEGGISIGNDCMISVRVNMQQFDSHPIFDVSSGERINASKSITVGNHVWVGFEAFLLGGCTIGNDCIVGARAVTSGNFSDGVILAGSPARVVREGITWRKDDLSRSAHLSHVSDCKLY